MPRPKLLDRSAMSGDAEAAAQLLPYVAPPAATAVGWFARTWYLSRQENRLAKVKETAIDRTVARVEKADQLDRLEKEVERKDGRIAQLEQDLAQLRTDLNALAVEVARYRAGLVAPHSYVLVPGSVVAAIRQTHPGALPGPYPGEETDQ